MLMMPGKCCKCGTQISMGGGFGAQYCEVICELDTKDILVVGVCPQCQVLPEEYDELTQVLRESFAANGYEFKAHITGVVGKKTHKQIVLEVQASTCWKCLQPLGKSFAVTNGRAFHDPCPTEKPVNGETKANVEQQIASATKRRIVNKKYAARKI
jgi:hypothetical protein